MISFNHNSNSMDISKDIWWHNGKESTCQCRRHKRHRFNPWVGKISWRRKWQPTPELLPEESHEQWSLVGYSPWGRTESNMTEHVHVHAKKEIW